MVEWFTQVLGRNHLISQLTSVKQGEVVVCIGQGRGFITMVGKWNWLFSLFVTSEPSLLITLLPQVTDLKYKEKFLYHQYSVPHISKAAKTVPMVLCFKMGISSHSLGQIT